VLHDCNPWHDRLKPAIRETNVPSKVAEQTSRAPGNQRPLPIDVGKILDRLFLELRQINNRIAVLERGTEMLRLRAAACRERTQL